MHLLRHFKGENVKSHRLCPLRAEGEPPNASALSGRQALVWHLERQAANIESGG